MIPSTPESYETPMTTQSNMLGLNLSPNGNALRYIVHHRALQLCKKVKRFTADAAFQGDIAALQNEMVKLGGWLWSHDYADVKCPPGFKGDFTYLWGTGSGVWAYAEFIVNAECECQAHVTVTTDSPETEALFEDLKNVFTSMLGNVRPDSLHILYTDEGGSLNYRVLGQPGQPLQRENYSSEVLSSFDIVAEDIEAKKPSGRIAVFSGPTGTGKTHLIRGLINACPNANFLLVPADLLESLCSPSSVGVMMSLAYKKKRLALIIEDADDLLVRRESGQPSGPISALLNMSDGLLGMSLDFFAICTTNLKETEMDDAVTRAGRMTCHANVGELSYEHAHRLLETLLPGKDVSAFLAKKRTLSEIYAYARGAANQSTGKKRNPIGIGR